MNFFLQFLFILRFYCFLTSEGLNPPENKYVPPETYKRSLDTMLDTKIYLAKSNFALIEENVSKIFE